MSSLFAFVHHLAAFTLFAALVVEFVFIRDEITARSARKLQIADMIFGLAAGVLLVVGFLRVFHFEKGAFYYFHTWTFITKLSLFVLIGLASIIPTVEFLSWRKAVREGKAPTVTPAKLQSLRLIIHLELVGVVVIILMAVLMAKGIGLTV
jgi:putative membrane protein